jgi:allantoinase
MIDDSYLRYPLMRHGMDQARYGFQTLRTRKPWQCAQGRVALNIIVNVEDFPLNPSAKLKPPGSMSTAYPDLRHKSLRDYGNRVGIFRIVEALEARGLRAGFAVNADLLDNAPGLLPWLASKGEIIAHGHSMDAMHIGGMEQAVEQQQIDSCVYRLRDALKIQPRGWLSPGKNQSEHTPECLKQAGIRYCLDWVNDELPYYQQTEHGALIALPTSTELEDRFVLVNNLHSEQSYQQQLIDAGAFLLQEAKALQSTRVLSVNVHAWLIGHAHRISYFEAALDALLAMPGVFNPTPGELVDAWEAAGSP